MMKLSEQKKKKKVLFVILFIVSLVVFLVSAVLLVLRFFSFKEDSYEQYKKPVAPTQTEEDLPENPIDFEALWAINKDVKAWITLPGTTIDHPIMQSGEQEEDFYLDHDLNQKYLFDGSVYIQKMNKADFTDPVTVIYGHDLANGKMFTPLRKFRKPDFFQQQDTIYVYTPGHVLTYRLYTAFVYDDRHILYSFNFNQDDEYQQFINETLAPKSMVRNVREGVTVTTEDKMIILSTCTNRASERYLVGGVLIDDRRTK